MPNSEGDVGTYSDMSGIYGIHRVFVFEYELYLYVYIVRGWDSEWAVGYEIDPLSGQ